MSPAFFSSSPKSPSLSHSLASLPPDPPKGSLFALALGVVPRGGGARPHQGGIRAGLSNCLRLKACLDTCRTSPSQACTSCFREAESAESRASTALVTWVKQRVRQYPTPALHAALPIDLQLCQCCPSHHYSSPSCPRIFGGEGRHSYPISDNVR